MQSFSDLPTGLPGSRRSFGMQSPCAVGSCSDLGSGLPFGLPPFGFFRPQGSAWGLRRRALLKLDLSSSCPMRKGKIEGGKGNLLHPSTSTSAYCRPQHRKVSPRLGNGVCSRAAFRRPQGTGEPYAKGEGGKGKVEGGESAWLAPPSSSFHIRSSSFASPRHRFIRAWRPNLGPEEWRSKIDTP
jgi:hypothetical protein